MTKIALITGTSSGIGLYTAVQFAQAGMTVIATMRNLEKSTALQSAAQQAGVELQIMQLDVQDHASVERCVNQLILQHGRIDVLVNNAGAGFLAAMEETSMNDLQQVMDVNFYGVWRVTQAVFPHMQKAGSGRIISVSSIGGLLGQPFNDAYCAAKFAVEGFMESLAPVALRLGIQVSLIEPGPVHSEFVTNVQNQNQYLQRHIASYDAMRDAYLAAASQAYAHAGQTAAEVAAIIYTAATAEQVHFRYATSDMIRGVISKKYTDPSGDSVLALVGARLP
ncbi:SDR family oxidoreductase [Undibacterium sp. Ren11W]|uniref:SDR family oxidoreductase n=1 Tax=Undibacterium sp. Ren11W TaxID=3413045 RepID=UPI003BF13196